ncbi:hypothetical protein QBC47DRAFT_404465 [Echria macrotheca]|uniref:Uncharacterized protein n=1 Tax=Echria macrotheca TaxID=438768 RepID=A0AAJ0F779_9PEZI|nr:hypothetical protein QBC47DRAFT_404465 [Echria macrotheca]
MASPDVVAAHANGVAALSRSESPAASVNSSTKRKRDSSDDGDAMDVDEREGPNKRVANGLRKRLDEKPLIRDFFDALQSLDPISGILKRPLPESFSDSDPSTKRAKSEDDIKSRSMADKVTQEVYDSLESFFHDLDRVVKAQIDELESAAGANKPKDEEAIAKIAAFKAKAFELWRREESYPSLPKLPAKSVLRESDEASGHVLTTVGAAPTLRPLYTSLRRSTGTDKLVKPIPADALPGNVFSTQVLPDATAPSDKNARPLTLGELFPSPRNLPPLQPPKALKNTTKGNVLTFYHPELTEKSKYRTGTYFSQSLTTGQWLDYSNATPTTHTKTKQRERAQSLAGHKPSAEELEMSEMEALFRGAFSSFAPCKDDSAALVSSRQASRVWWARVGQRSFNKLVESQISDDEKAEERQPKPDALDFDEDRVKEIIDNWDDSLVDPNLDSVLGKKSDEEKDTDDLLAEVSDMIETLLSHQRIRNLALPTSQDRYSTDPVNGDMLRNGSLSHQPSEEEMLAYQTLKSQLALIINTLPPFAVARLNSDKLEELAISTKIEVRTDEYKGVMEEDEPARLARQAAQVTANTNQRQQHRVSSVGSASPYPPQQYAPQFTPGARPIANAQHFTPQTPGRPQPVYPQRAPAPMPIPQPPQHYNAQRPQPSPQYRTPGHGYAPQLAKAPNQYSHSAMAPYAPNPSPQRPPQHVNYNMPPAGSPGHRYPQGYQQGFQSSHQPIHPQHIQHAPHQQHVQHPSQLSPMPPQPQHPQMHPQMPHAPQHAPHGQQPGFAPYTNGQQMPRNMSPQVPQAHHYGQPPNVPQQHGQVPRGSYGSPGMPPNAGQRPYPGGVPPPNMMAGPGGGRSGLTGYATVMPEVQQRQVMEQAKARADAEQRVSGHMGKVTQGEVVGLAGIGLGGTYDVNKIAAAKMQMGASLSPNPRMVHGGPSPINGGVPMASPSPMPLPPVGGPSPGPMHHGTPSPAVGQGYKPPAQPT